MNARAAGVLVVVLGASCAQVVSETRRERGPLLRSFERQASKEPAGLRAEAHASWPTLELKLVSSSVCRTESVREYAEEVVTERSSPAAGPSIAFGVTSTAVGAALLLFQGGFSNTPDYNVIDASGHYGPSSRQLARGWAIGLSVVGLPSIAVGVFGHLQSGESTSQRTVDQVLDARESRCDERPVDGKLAVLGPSGPQEGRPTQGGKVTLPPEALKGTVVGLALDGAPVGLDAEDEEELESFRACARTFPVLDDAALGRVSTPELIFRLEEAQRCARLPGAGGAEAASRLTEALATRAPPAYQSADEAVAALSPAAVRLSPGSEDVTRLARGGVPEGAAARVSGEVVRGAEGGLVLVAVGPQDLFVEAPQAWPEPGPKPGQQVELVGVLVGRHSDGDIDAPLLRAVYVRVMR